MKALMFLFCVLAKSDGLKTAVTFNAGLLPRILHYEQRAEVLASTLRQSTADVVCLQEVWFSGQVNLIKNEVRTVFPHSFSAVHHQPFRGRHRRSPCTLRDLFRLKGCVARQCPSDSSEVAKLLCAVSNCGLMNLRQDCISCLMLVKSPATYVKQCFMTRRRQMNVPGLLLLSKRPLREMRVVDFISNVTQLLPRSYLDVDIEDLGKVICTHLSSNLGPVYFEPLLQHRYTSWAEQNLNEMQHLTTILESENRVVLMGDLNAGPGVAGESVADFIASYDHLIQNDLTSPYVTEVAKCTYCTVNPFVDWPVSLMIDHVMLRGFNATSAQRVYDSNITGQEFPLSDHYGVKVTFGPTCNPTETI